MTKKDFELIASVINGIVWVDKNKLLKEVLVDSFARKLVDINPRFDKEMFLMACGIKTEEDITDDDILIDMFGHNGSKAIKKHYNKK